MVSIQLLAIIIAACQVGNSGMGGNYSFENTIIEHQKLMTEQVLNTQRTCQKQLIKCAQKEPLDTCLLK